VQDQPPTPLNYSGMEALMSKVAPDYAEKYSCQRRGWWRGGEAAY
jgi:hypothetical protein